MTDRPDIPDSAVVLALSRVEFGIDSVLDALRTEDPFFIRSILTEYSAQEHPNLAEKALIAAIDRLLRMKVPGHTEWPTLPLADRCDWWVERLGGFAAVVAGLPRISGAAADRLPIKDTLGAAVQAMVIGAVCREYGVEAHADRTAIMARVLTARPITPDEVLQYDDPTAAGQDVAKQLGLADDSDEAGEAGLRRGIRLVWRISKLFGGLGEVFEERPRGSLAARALGKLPGVGVVGGFFDERKGIRKAAYAAADLLTTRAFRVKPV
ncbi:hypothetical protein EV643_105201 [Kribbella sp. VKM Ac-2527]|uniref:Uncharacterized protein n=1 Tax=Kribbella caucasensis TaxID=2512215 RepID=A0A4R6KJ81_9ACTN|nr:hypothetical protein [Kribbella sp. VKM Ac-2527]TDO49971.1 hypothetical protein EV643_105201 [Kribbella sp. VKM Ac-2527]